MIMTERDALEYWCPLAKTTGETGNDAGNRYSSPAGLTDYPAACQCIASACMAWRWSNASRERGFCGAFGRPIEVE